MITKNAIHTIMAVCSVNLLAIPCQAVSLLSPNDFIIAIDLDVPTDSESFYPGGETPANALDQNPDTKYLNFGKENSGFIAKPFVPGTIVQSLQLTTANDAPARDPLTYELYGTNDTITSTDNGFGSDENWALISSGVTGLLDLEADPGERFTRGTVQSFSNSTPYDAYRVVFPSIRDSGGADAVQLADFDLFTSNDGSGATVFNFSNSPVVAFDFDPAPAASSPVGQGPDVLIDVVGGPSSNFPGNESPDMAIDANAATKYLNFGGKNSGFIVTPSSFGSSQVQSFRLTTGNDAPGRDPAAWEFYGTNDAISSGQNSFGTAENWMLIDSGLVAMPEGRNTPGPAIPVNNASSWSSYKMIFTDLKDTNDPNMQISEAELYLSNNGSGSTIVIPSDLILAIDEDPLSGLQTTYVNFGKENGGFIITPSGGSSVVDSFQITTGGDEPPRDPAAWALYGTNDPISSEAFGTGSEENWVQIDTGNFDMTTEIPEGRNATGTAVSVNNTTEYRSYRMVFTALRDSANANSVQLADVQFFGEFANATGDFDNDGDVDGYDFLIWQRGLGTTYDASDLADWQLNYGGGGSLAASTVVPEPSTTVLAFFASVGLWMGILRRLTWAK